MKEMDKKLRCRNTLWAVQRKDDKDIIAVFEYRSEARKVVQANKSQDLDGKLCVVRLEAQPEKIKKNVGQPKRSKTVSYSDLSDNQLKLVY